MASPDERLPPIVLDITLDDLYRQAGGRLANKRVGQVLSGASAITALGPNVRRTSKYIYQDGLFTSGSDDDTSSGSDSGLTIATRYLSLVPQRDAFISGSSSVLFYHFASSPKRRQYDRDQVIQTLATLTEAQRPRLVFCDGPKNIPFEEADIDRVACKVAHDDMDQYGDKNVIPVETHWFLNSKRALAESGLSTPASTTITVDGHSVDAQSCCSLCSRCEPSYFVIPEECDAARGTWLREQSAKLYGAIQSQQLPFVLKNQQTFGGAGTFIVRNEMERESLIAQFRRDGVIHRLLSAVNASNHHLEPATLILSSLIRDPVADYGITFFVNGQGRDPVFLGVSEQVKAGGTAWIGSIIKYELQDELRCQFESLVRQASSWLQSYGYIGPVGADVLETTDGGQHIVDLNVRITGSFCLPMLRTHFTSRDLQFASSFTVLVSKRRNEFMDLFRSQLEDGRLCILSWYEDRDSGDSLADVVAGAEDETGLLDLVDEVKGVSESITF